MAILKICRCKLKPLLEVLLMSLIITMTAFLLFSIIYARHFLTKDINDDGELAVRAAPIYSYKTRVAGLIEKIYPDENNHNKKLLCNGLIVERQTVIVLSDCFSESREKKPTKYVHFITSGSKYWSRNRNLHHVTTFSTIKILDNFITVIKVWPEFPLAQMGLPNKIFVENEYRPNEEHRIWGWDINSKKAGSPMKNILYVEECRLNMSSGILFTKDYLVSGLHYVYCNIGDPDTIVRFPTEEVEKDYPEIRVERIPKRKDAKLDKKTFFSTTIEDVATGAAGTTTMPSLFKYDVIHNNYSPEKSADPSMIEKLTTQQAILEGETQNNLDSSVYNVTIFEENCTNITGYIRPDYQNIISSFIAMPTVNILKRKVS